MKNRIFSLLGAITIAASSIIPSTEASFDSFYYGAPDFFVSSVSQDLDSYTYTTRVCNSWDTPSSVGTLRISFEKSGANSESRTFGNVSIESGKCQDFQVEGIYSFGKYTERNFPIYAVVSWTGNRADSNTSNNRKAIPAMAGATGIISATSVSTTRKDPLADLWKTADASQKYQYTNTTYGYWGDYTWYVNPNNYTRGTSGYYGVTPYNTGYYYGVGRPNFLVNRIAVDGNKESIMATYCNNGSDMNEFETISLRFEEGRNNSSHTYNEYIKLLSGQCRDITVQLSDFRINRSANYDFEVTVDYGKDIRETDENDNSYTQNIWIDTDDNNYSWNNTYCRYSSDGYYYKNSNRYEDSSCKYRVNNSNNSCYYSSSKGYYYKNGYYYTDSSCKYRTSNSNNWNNSDYYNNNNDGYYYRNSYPRYYGACTYQDGYYYANGYWYSDASCLNRR